MTDIIGPASALNAVGARPSDGRQYGASDTFFKDCSSASTQDGTQVSAAWLNQVTGVLRALARANGLKLDGVTPVVAYDQSDNMPLNGILQMIQRGQANWAIDKGTSDAMLATPAVAVAEYLPGMRFLVLKNPSVGANTTATPTINFGLGNLTVTKDDASAISPGDLKKGGIFEVELDGAGNARLTSLVTLSDVLALQRPPVIVTGPTTPTSGQFYAMDLGSYQTFTVPNPATLTPGWYCDLLVTGNPSGFQTASAQIAAGAGSTAFTYRQGAHTPFYLIGNGEILRFLWTGSLFLVLTLGQPAGVGVLRVGDGASTYAGGTGSNVLMPLGGTPLGNTAQFGLGTGTTTVPVSGVYQLIASTQFLSQSSTFLTGILTLANNVSATLRYLSTQMATSSTYINSPQVVCEQYLTQGSPVAGIINCPSGLSYVPGQDQLSVFLINR